MAVAALYDIHGNLPALEAVLRDVRAAGVREVVLGGDVILGPMSSEALALVGGLDLLVHGLRGNCENDVLAAAWGDDIPRVPERYRPAVRWTARHLDADARRAVEGWPDTLMLEIDGLGSVHFCHATPRDDNEIFTRDTPEDRLRAIFAAPGVPTVVCGHTHMPFDRRIGHVRVVNAGSVGMPFGHTGADWLRLGPDIAPQHTDYDLAAAAERVRRTSYPGAEEFAARSILEPPTEAAMLEAFGAAQIGPA